ncbi:unnamed protein product [Hydatigera taeniaeformis]|uniref:Btz domain-containing protein n=1 Tax=Hydatigena taeniaeformis TaxID=6205 RepID=A0A0R3WIX7_HYDTA|nr:unnamed protein product [Hydatigera taeniaeformis]
MSQIDDKLGNAAQTSDPVSSSTNPLQSLSTEKRQLLTNLLLLLTAQHRQQKLANRQIETASTSQQYPPVRSEFDCRPFKGPKTPPTPIQPPLPPSPLTPPSLSQRDYASHSGLGFRRRPGQYRQFYRPLGSPRRQRSFREPLESRRRPPRPQIRRDYTDDSVMSRLRMRSVVNVVVGRQRQRSFSTGRSSCSCADCEERKKRQEREDEEVDSCARTRPYQAKIRNRDSIVIERRMEETEVRQSEHKRRREWIPQGTYRRQLPWQRRRQGDGPSQMSDFGRHGRFVDDRTAGRRGRQGGWVREREWDKGRRFEPGWRGDFY